LGDEFILNIREQCPEASGQWQTYSGSTFCLSATWQLQLFDGHLHRRDDVPSGVAQRSVKVEYNQFYAHVINLFFYLTMQESHFLGLFLIHQKVDNLVYHFTKHIKSGCKDTKNK
jgi:hypothetical protein